MSKKLRNKKFRKEKCVYCNTRDSTTRDHVFPRKLFLVARRDKLPIVPSCRECNNRKSQLEVYLLTVLPFGASHSDALENFNAHIPRRLAKNAKLHRKLQASMSKIFIKNNNGILEPALGIDFNMSKLFELFNYITKALAYCHFNIRINSSLLVTSLNANQQLLGFFNAAARNQIERDLGNGTVVYKGIQAQDNEFLTLWEYKIYGGLHFLEQRSGDINSYTCSIELQNRKNLRIKFGA